MDVNGVKYAVDDTVVAKIIKTCFTTGLVCGCVGVSFTAA